MSKERREEIRVMALMSWEDTAATMMMEVLDEYDALEARCKELEAVLRVFHPTPWDLAADALATPPAAEGGTSDE